MGGGTPYLLTVCLPVKGLSPRGRGNLTPLICASPFAGLSPRGRGNLSQVAWLVRRQWGVYPRVGGGTRSGIGIGIGSLYHGLSPRGRGNHVGGVGGFVCAGSIPAWAGEPLEKAEVAKLNTVYPRVGGGTFPTPSLPLP